MSVIVSCAQMQPILFDVEENRRKMVDFVERINEGNPNTDLIIFPELITSGYECGSEFNNLAESFASGETCKIMKSCAEKTNTVLIYGFPERDGDSIYNSAAVIDRNGETAGVYRKVHLFDSERMYFKAGNDYPLIDTSIGRLGIMICWDTAFPEVARIYALKGAELLAVSTNWEKPYTGDWDLITRARAFDNTLFLAAANRIGEDKSLGFFGRSKIIDPLGNVVKSLDKEEEGFLSAELDLTLSGDLRKEYYTFFRDRRPETYAELVKTDF